MPRTKTNKSAPLAKFGLPPAQGEDVRARAADAPKALPPVPPHLRTRYTRGPFYLKIEGLTGPRPTSDELNAGRGRK